MLEPNRQPPQRLAREISHPPLLLRIGLSTADQRLPRPVGMKIQVFDLQRHELPPPRERFVRHAEHCALPIRAEPLACVADKFLDLLPPQRTRLRLPGGGFPS